MKSSELENVIRATAPDVLRYFERRVAQRADAADCLSEVLLIVWRERSRVPGSALEARLWMFGVARTVLRASRRIAQRDDAHVEQLRQALSTRTAPDEAAATDLALDVRSAIAALPDAQREVIELHHWDGMPLVDVARVVGTSASTVRSRYAAARATLAATLSAMKADRPPPVDGVVARRIAHGA